MEPLVSVVIPNFNHSLFLHKRITSILEQTFQDFELIILDDCSTDSSIEVLDAYKYHPKVSHVVINSRNSGSPFSQWNRGVDLAKGKYIWIAESDDWAETSFLSKMIKKIEKEPNCNLVYCRSKRINEKDEVIGVHNWGTQLSPSRWERDYVNGGINEIKYYLRFMNTIPNASAVLFRTKPAKYIIKQIPSSMRFCGDWFFWVKLLEMGDISFIAEPLNYFRRHESSTISFKGYKQEVKRIEEYFQVINEACKVSCSSAHENVESYLWILEEWKSKKKIIKNSFYYYTPPFPDFIFRKFIEKSIVAGLKRIFR